MLCGNIWAEYIDFQSLIAHYFSGTGISEHRDITLDAEFFDKTEEENDTAVYRGKLLQGTVSFCWQRALLDSIKNSGQSFNAAFCRKHSIFGHTTKRLTPDGPVSSRDTTEDAYVLYAGYKQNYNRFFLLPRKLFYTIEAEVENISKYIRADNFDADALKLPDSVKPMVLYDRFEKSEKINTTRIGLYAAAGIGRHKRVTALYQALFLEKILSRNGVTDFPLSEKTRTAVSRLLSGHNSYHYKKFDHISRLKAALDSILVRDEAVRRKNLRYISPFDIQRVLFQTVPDCHSGFRAHVFTRSIAEIKIHHAVCTFPYDIHGEFPDMRFFKPIQLFDQIVGVKAAYGIAVSPSLFIDMSAVRHLLSTAESVDFLSGSTNKIKWNNVLDVRWSMEAIFFVNHWLRIQGGFDQMQTLLFIPRHPPYRSFTGIQFFIEDYVSCSLNFNYYCGTRYDTFYYKDRSFLPIKYDGISLSTLLTYTF